MTEITQRQTDVLAVLAAWIYLRVLPPTVRDLCNATGMNINGMAGHLRLLRKKGYVTWQPHQARTLRVLRWPGRE